MQRIYVGFVIAALVLLVGAGCQTLREIAALRNVAFTLDHVTDARLAGVDVQRLKSYQGLSLIEVAQLGRALIKKELLLDFELHVRAENPPDNPVQARLVRMDWTLLIDDRETISGVFDDNIVLPPGQPTDVPIPISLNLVDFFEHGVQDLVELALSVAGQGGEPKRIKLQAIPTIDTALGPIRYPKPIVIISKEVGP
ncbi:LEA type 2 family protein [candidate division KSB1 bacterium]|nr:LEA type 2 family protein [candidate division KSB1 bacterium]